MKEMGSRELFDRAEGHSPFLLLDGYRFKAELEFIEHANDDRHKRATFIGVPYGTNY